MSKNMDKFPSIDDVHEVLSDLTKLFDDRNDLLKSMSVSYTHLTLPTSDLV